LDGYRVTALGFWQDSASQNGSRTCTRKACILKVLTNILNQPAVAGGAAHLNSGKASYDFRCGSPRYKALGSFTKYQIGETAKASHVLASSTSKSPWFICAAHSSQCFRMARKLA
jgi:hypothetical protein